MINKARYDFKVKNTNTWVYGCEYHWLHYAVTHNLSGRTGIYLISKDEVEESEN